MLILQKYVIYSLFCVDILSIFSCASFCISIQNACDVFFYIKIYLVNLKRGLLPHYTTTSNKMPKQSYVEIEIALLGLVKGIPQEALNLISRNVFANPHTIGPFRGFPDRHRSIFMDRLKSNTFTYYNSFGASRTDEDACEMKYCRARKNHIDKFFSTLYHITCPSTEQERLKDHPDIIGQRKLTTEFQIYNKMVYHTLHYDPEETPPAWWNPHRRPNRKPYKKLLIKSFKR